MQEREHHPIGSISAAAMVAVALSVVVAAAPRAAAADYPSPG